jgi:hypothetical protein
MGLPKKGSSKIDIADKSYRWAVSPDSGFMYIVVQLGAGKGQRLEVLVDYEPPVTPGIVRDCILEALKKGWKPDKPGSPFGLDRRKPVSYPTRATSHSEVVSPPVPPHKVHPAKKEGGYTCPVCSKQALSFVRDGFFSCGSCGRTFLPEDLRK